MVGERRRAIKRAVRHLRVLRKLAERAGQDHAAWARLTGKTSFLLRQAPGEPPDRGDMLLAARYARAFRDRRRQVEEWGPAPAPCGLVHDAAVGWLEALDLLSSAAAEAIAAGECRELDEVVREGHEATRRLNRFKAQYAETVDEVRSMVRNRPPTVRWTRIDLARPAVAAGMRR